MGSNDGDIFSIIQKYIVDGDVKAKQEKKTAAQEKEVFVAEEQQPLFQLVESEDLPDLMETIVDVSCDIPEEFDAIVAKVRGKDLSDNAARSKEAFSNVVVKIENGSTRRGPRVKFTPPKVKSEQTPWENWDRTVSPASTEEFKADQSLKNDTPICAGTFIQQNENKQSGGDKETSEKGKRDEIPKPKKQIKRMAPEQEKEYAMKKLEKMKQRSKQMKSNKQVKKQVRHLAIRTMPHGPTKGGDVVKLGARNIAPVRPNTLHRKNPHGQLLESKLGGRQLVESKLGGRQLFEPAKKRRSCEDK